MNILGKTREVIKTKNNLYKIENKKIKNYYHKKKKILKISLNQKRINNILA